MDNSILEKAEELEELFLYNYGSWTEESQKKAVEYLDLYLNDYIYSLYPDIDKNLKDKIIDVAEKDLIKYL